ncbi:glycosyltransferase 87 family protein [Patulibacter sp. NPDC049589]|uniref:glycosyltransferase 87 family protein n=1 Tax=Patulibacter sp. NPDC049589 TaxID=3154731 RepID=UPI003420320E
MARETMNNGHTMAPPNASPSQPSESGSARCGVTRSPLSTIVVLAFALLGAALLATLGLRDFAFTDYEAEAKPSIDLLLGGDVGGFLSTLPGYAGAVVLQAPFAVVGEHLGRDHDLWAWRAQALPGLLLLVGLGILLGRRVAVAVGGRRGTGWGALTALMTSGAPFALLALQTGHAEEALVGGLAVAAVLLASRGNLVTAGVLVGVAAVAKPWAVIAIPVVLLAAEDRRQLLRVAVACVVAGALLASPTFFAGGVEHATGVAHTSTSGIFKPDNVFWFAGHTNPDWSSVSKEQTSTLFETDAAQAGWAQRLEPAWAAKVSHPLIVAFAFAVALAFWRRRGRQEGRADLLLLLSAVCWWRCLLDTWNVHYYALAALLALGAWEAWRGRPPVAAAVVTAVAWVTFQLFPASTITPDIHTALYLAWGLPLGVGMLWRLLAPASAGRATARMARPLHARLPSLSRWVAPPVPN